MRRGPPSRETTEAVPGPGPNDLLAQVDPWSRWSGPRGRGGPGAGPLWARLHDLAGEPRGPVLLGPDEPCSCSSPILGRPDHRDHSAVKRDPAGRFYRTFRPVFAMVFGTCDQSFAQARAVHRIHSHIRGTLPETLGPFPAGSPYYANEALAALWVHATLCHTAVLVHERVLPPLTAAQKDRYWDEARRFAALFGIPDALLPPDWNAFIAYVESMLAGDRLTVGQAGRAIGDHLLSRAPGAFGRLIPGWYRGLTASLLPAHLRVAFGLSYGPSEAAQVARALD